MTIEQVFDEAKLCIIEDAMEAKGMHGVLTNLWYHVQSLDDDTKRLPFVRQFMGDIVLIDILDSKLPNYDVQAALKIMGTDKVCTIMLDLLVVQYAREVLGVD